MNKKENIKILNRQIDKLIIQGKDKTPEYTRLCKMHKKLIFNN
jgi:hypothetical protein